jgi:UDP-N-acetylglucosamine--N-acetylmuramyl-(pentapeptide) pyrophosphoryl-undecaprenol N-acetylglucosamine transferase
MIMAGGTGGHVFPGLAVAEALRARDCAVVWLGTERGIEARVVPASGIEIEWVRITGVRGRGIVAYVTAPFRMLSAVTQALAALRRRRPTAVLGMGGFVAAPGAIAAWLTRRPLVLHEQNSVAGTTNRLLAPLAAKIFTAFPDTFPAWARAEVVGNPVRSSIACSDSPRERLSARRHERRRLFVIGGSQGARALNEALPLALKELPPDLRPEIWHQAGRLGVEEARAAYAAAGVEARVDAFVDDVARAFEWADLVVARAGASTLAELAIVGVGAILIPLPTAIDDHQTINARHYTAGGAGVAMAQSELRPAALAQLIAGSLDDHARLVAMAEAARKQARPDSADRVARAVLELAEARA